MEEDNNPVNLPNTPIEDLDLKAIDLDALSEWFSAEAIEPSIGMEQNQVPALPAGKKRRSNDATHPRTKRIRIQHSHICDVHRPPSSKPVARCFGKRSRMGRCNGTRCERIVATFVDGQLPVCAQHKGQVMKMMRCKAILECGFSCDEIAPWKPHGYVLCTAHLSTGKCHLMELPVEIRLIIYRYLIPDIPVQARWVGSRSLRQDHIPVSAAIFRVSKTVHEEVADLLYGQTTFNIDVTNGLDNSPATTPSIFTCYARTAPNRGISSRPTRPTTSPDGIKCIFTPWQPSLSSRYFKRIRSFRINIIFDTPSDSSQTAETIIVEAERNLLCDCLHRVAESLGTNTQAFLQNLDISIRIHGISDYDDALANSKAIAHCKALIKPIRRLRSGAASLVSLTRAGNAGNGNREIDVLAAYPREDDSINKFVQSCCAELTSSSAPSPGSQVLVRFGQLADVVSQMSEHPFWRETDIEEMGILLDNGRSAREANDMKAMGSVFHEVFHKLEIYHADHQTFMRQMKQSCERVRLNRK